MRYNVSRRNVGLRGIDADYLAPAKYDQYYGAYDALPDWFLAELASREKVLELACGTGRIAIPLTEHGLEVTGIDYSEPMLRSGFIT